MVREPLDIIHEQLMRNVVKRIEGTSLVLKGGTALLFAYELDRFSEDLDFDSPKKLNLESRLAQGGIAGIDIKSIDTTKDTSTVSRYRINYSSAFGDRTLKIEISYRQPPQSSDVRTINAMRVFSLSRLADFKLRAAHDGQNTRSKARDLYDLEFLTRRWPALFVDKSLAQRLEQFSENPDALVARYIEDFGEDALVGPDVDVVTLALNLHENAQQLQTHREQLIESLSRIGKLSGSDSKSSLFLRHARSSIETARKMGTPLAEIDWGKIGRTTIEEAVLDRGDNPESILEDICAFSPITVLPSQIERLELQIRQIAQNGCVQSQNDYGRPTQGG